MDTRKAVAIRIQQLCAEHGHNINSAARAAGMPPTTGIVTIKALCDGLEISLYDFFNDEAFQTLEMEDIK